MRRLPFAARVYVTAVIGLGVITLAVCLPYARFDRPGLFAALLLLSSAAASLKVSLPLSASGSTMSVSYAVDFAALLLLGPHETMLVAAASAFSQCHLNTNTPAPLHRTLFSMASLVLTIESAGLAFGLLGGETAGSLTPLLLARPLVGAASAYFLLNTGFVATAIALSSREPVLGVWRTNFLWSAPSYFVGAGAAGAAILVLQRTGYALAPLAFVPLYLTYRGYQLYVGRIEDEQRFIRQTSDLHLATIEALARAIDAKDQTAHTHIRRVQLFAEGMARALRLAEPDIQGVRTAALLHDIGKLAVPEHILSKPGPLTQEEFQKIRIHPQVGAEIIAAVPFPYPVAPLILSHHEKWDGTGYPRGLKGEAIPIGARILTVVDYFDAVTADRPYHKALSLDAALALIRQESGRALEPRLVTLFIDLLPDLLAQVEREERAARPARTAQPQADSAAAPGAAASGGTAFENIALAHREIYALYEIAQSMGTSLGVADTMALISSKLTNLVPWSACALFLYAEQTDSMKCRYATGADVARLTGVAFKSGHGISGWVARNRRTIVNGLPAVEFGAAGLGDTDLKSALVVPLFFNDRFIGTLDLYHLEAGRYTDDHRRLVERIAEQAGPVIHNSMVFEQTQEDSLTDPLTGLPNRRSLFVHMSRELARAERLNTEVSLMVIDVDDFKRINDTYGHHIGDKALREVAQSLQNALRPYDLCVRYAGDEFIVVLADCDRDSGETKRKELQQRIQALQLLARPGKTVPVAASAGVAVYPHDGTSFEALLAEADHRMYRDKALRRGRPPAGAASPQASPAAPFTSSLRTDPPAVPAPRRVQ